MLRVCVCVCVLRSNQMDVLDEYGRPRHAVEVDEYGRPKQKQSANSTTSNAPPAVPEYKQTIVKKEVSRFLSFFLFLSWD